MGRGLNIIQIRQHIDNLPESTTFVFFGFPSLCVFSWGFPSFPVVSLYQGPICGVENWLRSPQPREVMRFLHPGNRSQQLSASTETQEPGSPDWPKGRVLFERGSWTFRGEFMGQNQWYHFGVGAPPILEPILLAGLGFSLGLTDLDFQPWHGQRAGTACEAWLPTSACWTQQLWLPAWQRPFLVRNPVLVNSCTKSVCTTLPVSSLYPNSIDAFPRSTHLLSQFFHRLDETL